MNEKLLQLPKTFEVEKNHFACLTVRYNSETKNWRAGYGHKCRLFSSYGNTPKEALDLLIEKMRESTN